jgi:hypothetical protein
MHLAATGLRGTKLHRVAEPFQHGYYSLSSFRE